jgi:hypothetical protein
MLAVSACGLIAGIALVPSNLIELTFQKHPYLGHGHPSEDHRHRIGRPNHDPGFLL